MSDSGSVEERDTVTPFVAGGITKNNANLFAAGDVIVWAAVQNSAPPLAFESPDTIAGATYKNLGWVDTSGFIFKLDETIKEIPASGILTSIRTILTGGTKSVQCNFLESLNPYVRSLFDDTPIFPVTTNVTKPAAISPFVASYIIPDPPLDNRYSLIFDSDDGIKQMRLYAPNCKVTARGNDQVQQADIEPLNMTFSMYPGLAGGTVSMVAKRYIDYSVDMSTYYT